MKPALHLITSTPPEPYVAISAEASLRVCGIAASARRVQMICSARSVPPERKAEAVRLLDEIAGGLALAREALSR